jgi:hypothetical protein
MILFTTTSSIILKNNKITTSNKLCKDCKYFIGDKQKCKYFHDIDLVTGHKTFKYASIMREYDCGENAKYFEENKIKFITVPYYFLKAYWMFIPVILLTLIYVLDSIKK